MISDTGKIDSLPGPAIGLAGGLGFAAAPAFALMAWMSAAGAPVLICSAGATIGPINDMALMYLLMSFFHLPPWLRLLSARTRHRNTPVIQT